ncbi:MAG TPA: hypothetical protein VK889_05295 [Solirubrobacterales bacterium]|nr:hypothetical protein [Solirubrobacterales bacterium]
MLAVAPYLLLLLGSFVPRVEDPLPNEIGLGHLFYAAGMGGVLGGVLFAWSTERRRDSAIKWGGVCGFVLGAALYLLALLVQVGSHL